MSARIAQSELAVGVARPAPVSSRVLLAASRAEAVRMARNPLVVAGLLGSAVVLYLNNFRQVPVWWSADVGIGAALLITAGAALIVAQLAAGRARRDGMTQLYDSYPAGAGVRAGSLLLGVLGPAVLAALLALAGLLWLDTQGAVGSPRLSVLAGALLLVPLGGAVGAALGSWLSHPLVGLLAAVAAGLVELDVVLAFDGWVQLGGPNIWLLPWTWNSIVLGSFPNAIAAIPPRAHLAELAGLIVLAAAGALWRTRWARPAVAAAAAAGLALTCWSGWVQDRPVPASQLTRLVYQAARPVLTQQCRVVAAVRYCYYPEFAPMVTLLSVPVRGVLGLLPAGPARPLTIRQQPALVYQPPLVPATAEDDGPADNIPAGEIAADLASWGSGSAAGASQLSVTAQVALWATGLAAQASGCLPLDQAREPIAMWLAVSATSATLSAFPGSDFGYDGIPTQVGRYWIATQNAADMQLTSQGLALAREMLRLPKSKVESVLAARWHTWLSPSVTDAELAGALGVPAPRLVTVPGIRPDGRIPGTSSYTTPQPPSPVCR